MGTLIINLGFVGILVLGSGGKIKVRTGFRYKIQIMMSEGGKKQADGTFKTWINGCHDYE